MSEKSEWTEEPWSEWDLFDALEVECAPQWDGHTPRIAADRLRAALAGEE